MTGKTSPFKVELGRSPESVESVNSRLLTIYNGLVKVEASVVQNYPLPVTTHAPLPNKVISSAAEQVIGQTVNSHNTQELPVQQPDLANSSQTKPEIDYPAVLDSTQPNIKQIRTMVTEAYKNEPSA